MAVCNVQVAIGLAFPQPSQNAALMVWKGIAGQEMPPGLTGIQRCCLREGLLGTNSSLLRIARPRQHLNLLPLGWQQKSLFAISTEDVLKQNFFCGISN